MISRLFDFIYIRWINYRYPNILIGNGTKIDWKSWIDVSKNHLVIGKKVKIRSQAKGYHAGMPFPSCILIDVKDAYVIIGANSRLNGVYVHAQKGIQIGENCVIAAGVNIIDSNGHQVRSENRTIGRDAPKEIKIGNNVWIGLNAIILKGTIIGSNSVVSAGSVVKGNFPDNSVISGNPAVVIDKIQF